MLAHRLSQDEIKEICVLAHGKHNDHLKEQLYQLTLDDDRRVAVNALWALTHFASSDHEWLYAKRHHLIDRCIVEQDATPEQRTEQIKYVTALCRQFGIAEPKIALIHCSEHVDERHFPCTADYLEQKKRAEEGFFGPVRIDGPLDLKTSCSPAALKAKNMESCVEGDADAVIVPDIEAGNVFYKTITLFCGAITAGILQGPTAPVVVPSRGDSPEAKFLSIAMAAMAHQ